MENTVQSMLVAWTYRHAILMLVGLGVVLSGAPMITAAALAASSFGVLTYQLRTQWTPDTSYGWANLVTACRFLLAGALLWHAPRLPLLAAGLAAAVLLLDGVDGWLARRFGSSSAYGDCLDKEVDAFFMVALCLALYRSERFGPWILIPGGLRYLYILFIHWASPPVPRQSATRWSRAFGASALGGLITCLFPSNLWSPWIGAIATAVVVASFARSFWKLYQR